MVSSGSVSYVAWLVFVALRLSGYPNPVRFRLSAVLQLSIHEKGLRGGLFIGKRGLERLLSTARLCEW